MRTLAERERLFSANERLAYFACESWMRKHSGHVQRYRLEREDLQTVALTALWEATDRHDASRGQFSTMATLVVFSRLGHVLKGCTTKKNGGGEAPETVSLQAIVPGTEEATLLDTLTAPDTDRPESTLPLLGVDVWRLVEQLPANQSRAIKLYYGMEMTTDEAGQIMGVSRQCVNQHMKKGLTALRQQLQAPGLLA